jgi:type VI secretion system protein ImpG
MGFSAEESLLPYTPRSFQGYRLLQEYFSFQEKFLFFHLHGLADRIEETGAEENLELLFYFSSFELAERMQTLEVGVTRETVRLHCSPIINLFSHVAEPVLVSQKQHEYPIVPSVRNRSHIEVFSIEAVSAANPSRRTSLSLPPLFERRFQMPNNSSVFWRSVRRYSPLERRNPSQIYLSIVDADGEVMEPEAEVLTAKSICTNHDLPSQLPIGNSQGDFYLENVPGIEKVRCLHRPTASSAAPVTAAQAWSLVSQLSLNHLSLGEDGLAALKEILRLHNFAKTANLEKQIAGILSMHTERRIALLQSEFGSAAVRGMRVELELEESHFVGGGAYLFGAVLEHFFGLYVSMNSFSQLVLRSKGRKEVLGEWTPRAGSQTLL